MLFWASKNESAKIVWQSLSSQERKEIKLVLKSDPVMQNNTTKKYFFYIHSYSPSWILWWIEIGKEVKGAYELSSPLPIPAAYKLYF